MRADIKAFLKTALSLKQEDGPCLEWPFAKNKAGRGRVQLDGKLQSVPRIICKLVHGNPLNEYFEAAHSCHNPSCCRPAHLRWATRSENMSEQRSNLADKKYKATQKNVDIIRASKLNSTQLSRQLGLSASNIRAIKRKSTWK